jgi:hypothetical protein
MTRDIPNLVRKSRYEGFEQLDGVQCFGLQEQKEGESKRGRECGVERSIL